MVSGLSVGASETDLRSKADGRTVRARFRGCVYFVIARYALVPGDPDKCDRVEVCKEGGEECEDASKQ